MIMLFITGGIAGFLSAAVTLLLGASWATALGAYVGIGLLFPVMGMIRIDQLEKIADINAELDFEFEFDPDERFEDTYAQWAADPESRPSIDDDDDIPPSRVA